MTDTYEKMIQIPAAPIFRFFVNHRDAPSPVSPTGRQSVDFPLHHLPSGAKLTQIRVYTAFFTDPKWLMESRESSLRIRLVKDSHVISGSGFEITMNGEEGQERKFEPLDIEIDNKPNYELQVVAYLGSHVVDIDAIYIDYELPT